MKKLKFVPRKDFQTDLKKLAAIDRTIVDDVLADIDLLCEAHKLPDEFSDHALTRQLEGYRDFHVRSPKKGEIPTLTNDVVVIYKIVEDKLIVIGAGVGSHNHLFGGQNSAVKYHRKRND